MKSVALEGEAWATYAGLCAMTIAVRSLRFCCLPELTLPAGAVVVSAPFGVELERWMPVFMYASLS